MSSFWIIFQHIIRAVAREAVEAVGAQLLFLPPYSPDFNPIENIFAKMKAWIRRMVPRTLDALQHAVCGAIDDISHSNAAASSQPQDMNQADRIML